MLRDGRQPSRSCHLPGSKHRSNLGRQHGRTGFDRTRVGIAPLRGAWQQAIYSTFLRFSNGVISNGTSLGSRNLWTQSGFPTPAAQIDGNPANTEVQSGRGKGA